MSYISKNTFKNLFTFFTIGQFSKGVYGLTRLNKVVFLTLDEFELLPFEFLSDHYGPHSETLDESSQLLLSMNHINAYPLQTGKGLCFIPTHNEIFQLYNDVIKFISPELPDRIKKTVEKYGYLSLEKLIQEAKSKPSYVKTKPYDIIWGENLPAKIKVTLSDSEAEDLELSLNSKFIAAMEVV